MINSDVNNMKIAQVRIKGDFGHLSLNSYYFYTDYEDLLKGDTVLVISNGLQLAIFEQYVKTDFKPEKFIVSKISDRRIRNKLFRLKKKEVLGHD